MNSRRRRRSRSRRRRRRPLSRRRRQITRTTTTRCRFCSFFEKLIIHTTVSPKCVYNALAHRRTARFARSFKFVNGTFAVRKPRGRPKTFVISLRGHHTYPSSIRKVAWNKIKCKTLSPDIKLSPCSIAPRNKKIFYRRANDLRQYILRLSTGIVSLSEHSALFRAVFSLLGRNFINSNREIQYLHFKER